MRARGQPSARATRTVAETTRAEPALIQNFLLGDLTPQLSEPTMKLTPHSGFQDGLGSYPSIPPCVPSTHQSRSAALLPSHPIPLHTRQYPAACVRDASAQEADRHAMPHGLCPFMPLQSIVAVTSTLRCVSPSDARAAFEQKMSDRAGRARGQVPRGVAVRAVTTALGWRGGDRLTLTAETGVVVACRDRGGMIICRPGRP